MNWNKLKLKWIDMELHTAWSDLSGMILSKHNLSISLHTDNLNVQLQLHVRISVSKCITKLTYIKIIR